MKNLFAFGFLAFALTVASCGGGQTTTEETADSLKEVIDTNTEAVVDSLNAAADSAQNEIEAIADSAENVL